ncbi:MAG: invasion associated locus B family protein [Rhodobacter sp.]|jgi:invasion protein IalB|nr:invasion associated locus B family protein [Rhodobacter sp.]
MEDRMTLLDRPLLLALGLTVAMAGFGVAQETTAPETPPETTAPADGATGDLSMGTEAEAADGPGTTYTAATFEKWEQRCMRTEDGADPCQLYQLLQDGQGNNVAEVSLFALPPGQQAVAGATIVVPLETLLTEQLTIAVDGAQPKRYPFTWCAPLGCIARVGFTQAEIDGFKKGAKATITIVPAGAPDQPVNIDLSLKGFTAGFDAVSKTPVN